MEPIREAEMQTQPGKRLSEESKKSGIILTFGVSGRLRFPKKPKSGDRSLRFLKRTVNVSRPGGSWGCG